MPFDIFNMPPGTHCKTHPDLWYPERGTAQIQAKTAKSICNGEHPRFNAPCPFRDDCLEGALERNERFGVWGGMSEPDRQKERRRRKKLAEESLAKVIPITSKQENTMASAAERAAKLAKSKAKTPDTARKATGTLARWANIKKVHGRLLPQVQRHLLTRPQDEDRAQHLIHVSELAKNDWCPRAAYLRIKAARSGEFLVKEAPHFQLDNIFEEGDRIHEKWQSWFWDMGVLWGRFYCHACGHEWWEQSPKTCANCDASRGSIRYSEVAMHDMEHLIVGHADGEIRDDSGNVLIEIKSVGAGTIRVEQPSSMAKHTHHYVDEDGVARTHFDHEAFWRDLHRPLPSHVRQGSLYLYLRRLMAEHAGWPELRKIVFIYEYKPTQATKEFEIELNEEWVAEVLEDCKDVVYALETDVAPVCKAGRSRRCAACATLIELEKKVVDGITPRSKTQARRGDPARQGAGRKQSAAGTAPAERRTRIARRPDRPERPRVDEPADAPHSLGRLLGRSTGDGLHRRTGS